MQAAGQHPAHYVVERMQEAGEYHNMIRSNISTWLAEHGSVIEMLRLDDVAFPDVTSTTPFLLPLDSICWPVPSGGLPPAVDWQTHLLSIVTGNYDSRRCPVDVRPRNSQNSGRNLQQGSVVLVKGFTRTSIVAFCCLVLFENTMDSLDDEEGEMLTRCFGVTIVLS